MTKKILIPTICISMLGFIFLLFCLYVFFHITPWVSFSYYPKSLIASTVPEESFPIPIVPENLKQSGYFCGSYSMYFVSQSLQNSTPLEMIIQTNKQYEIPRTGVVPEVLVHSFKKIGIDSKVFTFRNYSPDEKKQALQSLLQQKPIILLVKRHGYLHFITLTGYHHNTVYLYDSMLPRHEKALFTIDTTSEHVGNDMMNFDELIQIWEDASVFFLYRSMAIVFPNL